MKRQAKDLIFLSEIKRDGSELIVMSDSDKLKMEQETYLKDEFYNLQCLSITNGTYIASCNRSYIVKLKPISDPINGLLAEITKKQENRGYFSKLPIGTKFIIIDRVDLPAYDIIGYFLYSEPHLLENGRCHHTGYLDRDSWKIIGEVKENINLFDKQYE